MSRHYDSGPKNPGISNTLEKFRSELDRLVDMAWTRGEEAWEQMQGNMSSSGDWTPAVDIVETLDSLIVFVNLPGLNADDVELSLVGNTLEIQADLDSLTLQDSDKVHHRERPTGRILRQMTLPCPVNNESATAHADQGVFKIEMKKVTDSRVHKVKVQINETKPEDAPQAS